MWKNPGIGSTPLTNAVNKPNTNLLIKQTGGKRKNALLIWTLAGYSKERFNNDLWPKDEA
ncbi:hypothetical protein [Lentibacillus daqui]|uniref:hypothetical protein n=1 Tax=Lentibacillus daqui TaxID=2911514 RepID=UPI0022B1068B|nr:hypothetical protein [Lentibacillus daqui]